MRTSRIRALLLFAAAAVALEPSSVARVAAPELAAGEALPSPVWAQGPRAEPRLPRAPVSLLGRDPGLVDGELLAPFAAALARASAGGRSATVAAWGASHTACDHWVGGLRRTLQARYGDGGRGFTFPAWPNDQSYWQNGVRVERGVGWARVRLGRDRSVAGHYGVAGLAFDSEGREASAQVHVDSASVVVIHHRQSPTGGRYAVRVDGVERTVVDTRGATAAASVELEIGEGSHSVELLAEGGAPVVLYGLDFRHRGGVRVHNLGLSGSRARYHHKWLEPVHSEQLRALGGSGVAGPDLLVFAYGGNEGNDFGEPMSLFAGQFERAIRRARSIAPEAACLVIGPADKPLANGDGWLPRGRTLAIARIEKRVAERSGCAYFDTLAFMGGPLSMLDWVEGSPPMARRDYVHFNAAGYARMSEALVAGMDEAGALPAP